MKNTFHRLATMVRVSLLSFFVRSSRFLHLKFSCARVLLCLSVRVRRRACAATQAEEVTPLLSATAGVDQSEAALAADNASQRSPHHHFVVLRRKSFAFCVCVCVHGSGGRARSAEEGWPVLLCLPSFISQVCVPDTCLFSICSIAQAEESRRSRMLLLSFLVMVVVG